MKCTHVLTFCFPLDTMTSKQLLFVVAIVACFVAMDAILFLGPGTGNKKQGDDYERRLFEESGRN